MKILFVALAATVSFASPATATHRGECVLDVDHTSTTTSGYDANVAGIFVVSAPDGTPATATVTCEVRVNGAAAGGASASGTGVVAVAGEVVFTATAQDVLELCAVVDYAGAQPPEAECEPLVLPQYPPAWVFDVVDTVLCLATGDGCPAR